MRSILVVLVTTILSSVAAVASPPAPVAAPLQAFYDGLAADGGLNGVVLVAENGKLVYGKAYGYADFEARRPNTLETRFEIASVAKTFTATAVLQLAEKGRIDLDAPAARYLRGLPYRTVTVRQLLSHSSGLSDQDLAKTLEAYERRIAPRPMRQDDLIPALVADPGALKLRPGERWWYANIGYQLLALIVERVSGRRFDAYVRERILEPAGMSHTYLKAAGIRPEDDPAAARNYDYPQRYASTRVRLDVASRYYGTGLLGAAGVVTTAPDLLKFDQALRTGRLLKASTLEAAYAPARLADGEPVSVWLDIGGMGPAEDGLGWFVFKDRTHGRVVWHSGGMSGCATIFLRALDTGRTVIVLDNTNSEGLYKAGLSALRILDGEPPVDAPHALARIYARTLMEQGPDAAFARLVALRGDSRRYVLRENDMNNLAYDMLADGRLAQALETFKINAALFPDSDNVYNSYAEALERAGRVDDAITMHQKALATNPGNEDSKAALARLRAGAAGGR